MARRYALIARASFHRELLAEHSVRGGESLQIGGESGGSPHLPVPLPEGVPYLARILWTSRSTAAVRDGAGNVHHAEPGRDVVIEAGPLEVRVSVVERFSLRRTEPLAAIGSVAWLLVVVMITALSFQWYWLQEHRCPIAIALLPGIPDVGVWIAAVGAPLAAAVVAGFVLLGAEQPRRALPMVLGLPLLALLVPVIYGAGGYSWQTGEEILQRQFASCFEESGGHPGGSPVTAEYLARLLRNDLEGEDQGVIETEIERPEAERKLGERDIFLPAGADGPITRMGGAEQVAPEPVRTLVTEEQVAVPSRESDAPELVLDDGRPIQRPEQDASDNDGTADGLDVPQEEDADGSEAPAEEHEGWGLQAWYDEEDEAMDQLEIELMLRAANNRLRIDPDDPAALSILSYYQYLAQDYGAAKKTYDRFIELYPNDPAGYNNKALVYKREGEYQKEEALYRVALSLSPNDVTAMNNLGVNLAHQKRFPEALAVMEQLEIIDPNDPYADLHRSKIQAEMGNDEEALRYLDLALQGMERLDTLHHIEFRQDIRLDPSFAELRETYRFRQILEKYYGKDSPLQE